MLASEQDIMGENVVCTSLVGEEIGRLKTWGTHPLSRRHGRGDQRYHDAASLRRRRSPTATTTDALM